MHLDVSMEKAKCTCRGMGFRTVQSLSSLYLFLLKSYGSVLGCLYSLKYLREMKTVFFSFLFTLQMIVTALLKSLSSKLEKNVRVFVHACESLCVCFVCSWHAESLVLSVEWKTPFITIEGQWKLEKKLENWRIEQHGTEGPGLFSFSAVDVVLEQLC